MLLLFTEIEVKEKIVLEALCAVNTSAIKHFFILYLFFVMNWN